MNETIVFSEKVINDVCSKSFDSDIFESKDLYFYLNELFKIDKNDLSNFMHDFDKIKNKYLKLILKNIRKNFSNAENIKVTKLIAKTLTKAELSNYRELVDTYLSKFSRISFFNSNIKKIIFENQEFFLKIILNIFQQSNVFYQEIRKKLNNKYIAFLIHVTLIEKILKDISSRYQLKLSHVTNTFQGFVMVSHETQNTNRNLDYSELYDEINKFILTKILIYFFENLKKIKFLFLVNNFPLTEFAVNLNQINEFLKTRIVKNNRVYYKKNLIYLEAIQKYLNYMKFKRTARLENEINFIYENYKFELEIAKLNKIKRELIVSKLIKNGLIYKKSSFNTFIGSTNTLEFNLKLKKLNTVLKNSSFNQSEIKILMQNLKHDLTFGRSLEKLQLAEKYLKTIEVFLNYYGLDFISKFKNIFLLETRKKIYKSDFLVNLYLVLKITELIYNKFKKFYLNITYIDMIVLFFLQKERNKLDHDLLQLRDAIIDTFENVAKIYKKVKNSEDIVYSNIFFPGIAIQNSIHFYLNLNIKSISIYDSIFFLKEKKELTERQYLILIGQGIYFQNQIKKKKILEFSEKLDLSYLKKEKISIKNIKDFQNILYYKNLDFLNHDPKLKKAIFDSIEFREFHKKYFKELEDFMVNFYVSEIEKFFEEKVKDKEPKIYDLYQYIKQQEVKNEKI